MKHFKTKVDGDELCFLGTQYRFDVHSVIIFLKHDDLIRKRVLPLKLERLKNHSNRFGIQKKEKTDKVLFYRVEAGGNSLDDARNPIEQKIFQIF